MAFVPLFDESDLGGQSPGQDDQDLASQTVQQNSYISPGEVDQDLASDTVRNNFADPGQVAPNVGPTEVDYDKRITAVKHRRTFKVRLRDGVESQQVLQTKTSCYVSKTNTLIFEASSPVSESRSATYDGYNIVHLPTSIWAYRNTSGRHFSITGKLVSRTPAEADVNSASLSMVRAWMLPGFGTTGSTPPILYLSVYGHEAIDDLPCILINYDWGFPEEVDYIFSGDEPMPVIGTLTLTLEEAYSPTQITEGAWKIRIKNADIPSFDGLEPNAQSDGGELFYSSSNLFDIAQNPTSLSCPANSPEISESTSNIIGLNNNQFVGSPANDPAISGTGTPGSGPPPFSVQTANPFGKNTNLPPWIPTT